MAFNGAHNFVITNANFNNVVQNFQPFPVGLHGPTDLCVFLCKEFEAIRQSHPLKKLIPAGWPSYDFVQLLLDKSSGDFDLPATATKYIKTSQRNPVESLEIIVGLLENPSLDTSKPFAELDALYSHILHLPDTDIALIKRILHCILGFSAVVGGTNYRSPCFFDEFLGLPPDTTTTALCHLHSLVAMPYFRSSIQFHYKSLEDYLLDPERSQDLFQSPYDTQVDITIICAMNLTRWDAKPVTVIDLSIPLYHTAHYWYMHVTQCIAHKPTSTSLLDIILNIDPRMAVKYRFVHDYNLDLRYRNLSHSIHEALCSTQHCVRLCQLMTRVDDCLGLCKALDKPFGDYRYKERLEALPRFLSETGLYAPVDPESRTVFDSYDTPHLQNPPAPDLPENPLSTNLLQNPSTPDLTQSPSTPDPLPNPPTPDLPQNPPTPDLQKPPTPALLPNPPTLDPLPHPPTPDHPKNPPAPNIPQNPPTPDLLLPQSPTPDLLSSPPTPDLPQSPPTPDHPKNPSTPNLPQKSPVPDPSFLRRVGHRIRRRFHGLCQGR